MRAFAWIIIVLSLTTQARAQIVSHPSGCPWRVFCGCAAAVHIFGKPIKTLWAARAWFKFPRATPAPGMAAVRAHHVMVLESHVGGKKWIVYDANSGGHATRVHERSIAGFTIVDPHGNRTFRTASNETRDRLTVH